MFKQLLPIAALLSTGILTGCPQTIEKPSIVSFVATPATLPVGGGTSKLSWEVKGADTISIDQSVGVVTGTFKDVNVTSTTQYKLTAVNSGGTVSASATVTVPVNSNVISGKLASWTRGEKIVRAEGYDSQGVYTLAQGNIVANGDFSVTLPDLVAKGLNPILTTTCPDIIVSPPSTAVTTVSSLTVMGSQDQVVGRLVHGNNDYTSSQNQPGDRLVFYVYADRDATVKGNCTQNSTPFTVDWVFKKGWNPVFLEYNTGNIRYSNNIPSNLPWRFVSLPGKVEISNAPAALEVGQSVQLSANALEADGTEIPNVQFDWSVSDSKAAEISTDGILKIKQASNGFLTVQVNVKGQPSVGGSVSIQTYGLRISAGTLNIADKPSGTAINLWYTNADGSSGKSDFDYVITGPSGWNGGTGLNGSYKASESTNFILSEIPAVTGTYNLQILNSPALRTLSMNLNKLGFQYPMRPSLYVVSPAVANLRTQEVSLPKGIEFYIDASRKGPFVKSLKLTSLSQSEVQVMWEQPEGAYGNFSADLINTTNQIVVASAKDLYTSASFRNLALNSSLQYEVYVYFRPYIFSSDFIFDVSRTSLKIDFSPKIYSLNIQGGSIAGGYPIEIKGIGFNIDTIVRFGTTAISSVALVDSSTLRVNVPAGTVGEVDVTVINANGTSSANAFTKFKYYENQEYSAVAPTQLLQGLNGDIYYTDTIYANFANSIKLIKITDAGVSTSVDIPVQTNNPNDMVLDSSGNVWMLFNQTIVKVSPTGVLTTVSIPGSISAGVIAIGSDGNIWIGHANESKISRFDQSGSNLSSFTLPVSNCCSNGGFYYSSDMVLGADNNLWFTNGSYLGRVKPDGSIILLPNNSSSISGKLTLIGNDLWASSGFGGVTKIALDGTITSVNLQCGAPRVALSNDGFYWCAQGYYYSSSFGMARSNADGSIKQQIALPVNPNQSSSISDFIGSTTGKMWYISNNKVGYIQP
jgi:IPT/TIG domain